MAAEGTIKAGHGSGHPGVPVHRVHTLVIGSGAAGLGAAIQLHNQGVEDVLIVTEGLKMGTSINTGSDKQTYYKISLSGDDADSPMAMARNYFAGGSMHGDLALVEASLSARAFLNLVNLGVPFPQDSYGQFVGYKTDHDPRRRATSIGPYTSREMCRRLIAEIKRLGIEVREKLNAVSLLTVGHGRAKRAAGAVAIDRDGGLEVFVAENVVFAVGGPGGLYRTSVYPIAQTGAIGLALMAGARAQGLPESQYGLASVKFRWNVSGSYMQVVPRFISTDARGRDEQEFLLPYFKSPGDMCSRIFMKGYQWPFDAAKVVGGSSIIDILVHIEIVEKGRRVFLDFRRNATGFAFEDLSDEARTYLENSKALQENPIGRLAGLNPGAIDLYLERRIDIRREPLEIAVCAQHNNGGLSVNHWWESTNIRHLFPLGEAAGTHGVSRPGGASLNAGQVGGIRLAEFIANRYAGWTLDEGQANKAAGEALESLLGFIAKGRTAPIPWPQARRELQARMSRAGAHIRSAPQLMDAVSEARGQWNRMSREGCGDGGYRGSRGVIEALRNRHLCFAHLVYLEALRFAVNSGMGSRGSAIVLARGGRKAHPKLGDAWRFLGEDSSYREKVMETVVSGTRVKCRWVPRRPIPRTDLWFETAWAAYCQGDVYD